MKPNSLTTSIGPTMSHPGVSPWVGDARRETAVQATTAIRDEPPLATSGPEQELLAITPCRVSKSYAPAAALVLSGAAEWQGTPPFEILVATSAYRKTAGLARSNP